jgi:hypothetical protein
MQSCSHLMGTGAFAMQLIQANFNAETLRTRRNAKLRGPIAVDHLVIRNRSSSAPLCALGICAFKLAG